MDIKPAQVAKHSSVRLMRDGQQVAHADKLRNAGAGRAAEDMGGRLTLHQATPVNHGDPVTH